ncbi:hypothetical protein CaCOL14_001027 [Colletotrichum acutatum]
MSPRPISAFSRLTDEETPWDRPLLSSRSKSIDEDSQGSSDRQTNDWAYAKVRTDPRDQHEPRLKAVHNKDQYKSRSELSNIEDSTKTSKPITRTKWSRLLNGWIVHFPAILVTIAVLLIGSVRFYWYPEIGPVVGGYRLDTDVISNILQLVAKLHELLIVASLSAVALAIYRRHLVTSGIRLGFLTGGYRVGDLTYLTSSAFRRQGLDTSKPWEMLLPAFLVFATIVSTIVGPASAVLLLPSLGWYEFDTSLAFSKIEPPLLYGVTRNKTWFESPFGRSAECKGPAGVQRRYCTASGFPEILSWVRDYAATDLTNNITFHATSSEIRRHLVFTQADEKSSVASTTLCTTPPHFLMTNVGLFQQFIRNSDVGVISREPRYRLTAGGGVNITSPSGNGTGLYQPFVQSKCAIYDRSHLQKTVDWAPSKFSVDPGVSDTLHSSLNDDESMRKIYRSSNNTDVRVMKFHADWFRHLNPGWNLSDTARATGIGQIIMNFSSKQEQNGTTVNVLAPVDGTNNTAAEIFLAKVFGVYLLEGLARGNLEQRTRVKLNETEDQLTYLDLNEQHGYRGGIHTVSHYNNTHHRDKWNGNTVEVSSSFADFKAMLNTTFPMNFTAERYGYGSGQGRKTLEFAQVMMLIYLGTITFYAASVGIGYVLELLKFKSGGKRIRVLSVIPWSDLQDLIILALKTPPPSDEDLADAGAGVTSEKVWEKVVRAESDDKRNVQLAFQETTHTRKLDVTRKERYY